MYPLIWFVISVLSTVPAAANSIDLVGSDFMWPWIEDALGPLDAANDSIDIAYSMKGSFPGLTDIRLDDANLGIIAIAPGESVPERPLVSIPIGYHVAYILVHKSNQLREISSNRLAGIFGANEETDYGQWGQLGLLEWEARTINPAIHSGENSLADSIFRYTVLRTPELKGGVAEHLNAEELESFISKNENVIAVSSRSPNPNGQVRALPVALDIDSPGYVPTPETVHFRDYQMVLPYYLVFPESERSVVEPIVRYLLSDRFASRLEQEGFMPLPQRERQRLGITLGRQ
ncbi:MAG: PstS family phosphate ABC transporter substrate-binding protein [Opitutales bacterium]